MMYLKVNSYIRNLINYFEQVLHPAGGLDKEQEKRKRRNSKRRQSELVSPENFNIRGASKKGDKLRLNPAP